MKLSNTFWLVLLFTATALLTWLSIYWFVMEVLSSPIPPTYPERAWIETLTRTQ